MSAHPGSQCAKCGCDVHGEELCGWCEADALRSENEALKADLKKARDTIAWMMKLPGVTREMARDLFYRLGGGR